MTEWNNPMNWLGGFLNLADTMNEQVYENFGFLFSRPQAYLLVASTNTTSTTFVEVTSSSVSLDTYGGDIWLAYNGTGSNSGTNTTTFDLAIDGLRQGDTTIGMTSITTTGANRNDCILMMACTQAPNTPGRGSHTFSVYWKTTAGTAATGGRLYVCEFR